MLSLSHDETNTIEATIDRRLGEQGNSIRNRAAFGALIKLVPHFGESLHHALTAGDDAIRDEKIAMQLDYLCGLVQRIDAVITEVLEAAESKGLPIVEISGKVSVRARDRKSVV